MDRAITETNRRREIQDKYNKDHGIIPQTVRHNVKNTLEITKKALPTDAASLRKAVDSLTREMKAAANELDFEKAIKLREDIARLKKQLDRRDAGSTGSATPKQF